MINCEKIISSFLDCTLIVFNCISAFSVTEGESEFCLKIVHTNDIHSRVIENESGGIIGVSKLKTLIDEYTQNSDMSLVLDSGDLFHGQSIATLVKGESIAKLAGTCGYDAMTAGNHDWNYGKDRLKELVNITNENDVKDFKMLTGNVINNDGTKFFDDEFLIKTTEKNGETLKVGVFGVIDPSIYSKTSPTNVSGLVFTDMKKYSDEAVDYLENQGCQLIIGLTHCYNPTQLASEVNGVDLLLAGHEHININQTVATPNGEQTLVIENGYYLYQAGLLELDFDLNDKNEIENLEYKTSSADYSVCAELKPDSNVDSLLAQINDEQSVILNKVVGSSPAELDGVWEHLRIDETNLGRAVTNAYLLETGADVAFENAGGIRASIKKGDVLYGDIIGALPYGNYIVTKTVTGQDLLEILETSIDIQIKSIAANDSGEYDAWPKNSGSYLQIGGMTVEYNISKPYGERVESAFVGAKKLENDSYYTVATNNFAAVSSVYLQLATKEECGEFSACDEALINFFNQDDEKILTSVNTPRMIQTTTPIETVPPTSSVSHSESTAVATAATDPTSATSNTTANAVNKTSTPDTPSNGIATGSGFAIFSIITVVIIFAASFYIFRRKRLIK